jgi:F-type H+-transporting ATPase subunit b
MKVSRLIIKLLVLSMWAFFFTVAYHAAAYAQEQPAAQPPAQTSSESANPEPAKKEDSETAPRHKGPAGELVEQTRESTGADEEEEENVKLKHASAVQWLANKTGLTVHQAHLVALTLNFAIVAIILLWAARKYLPTVFRNRSASIQQALEEARAASQDANRRLADIENRLRQLDVEIGQMQANAEREATAEEGRIQKAAEDDIRKVVLSAEQEIARAAKQARRELSTHTAGLAIALARKQINVDANTDQVLVRTFALKLAPNSNDDGKDGR